MNKYLTLKEKHQKEVNDFPFFFAFSNEQFEEGIKSFGLQPKETDKIYKFGNTGGFYKREDSNKLNEMFERHEKEVEKARKDYEYLVQMFKYELANHEYNYTRDIVPTIQALGLSVSEVKKNRKLLKALTEALNILKEGEE